MQLFIFNGKSYKSLDEMPANERQAYEQVSNMFVDKNGNGIPDFLEGDVAQNVMTAYSSSITLNGTTYNSMNELPPEVREKVQGAFEKLAQMGIVTKNPPMMAQTEMTQRGTESIRSTEPILSHQPSPVIEEDKSSGLILWIMLGIGFGVIFALAVAALYFMK